MAALLAASRAESPADRRYTVALTRTALEVISTTAGLPQSEPVSLAEVTTRFSSIRAELGIEATLTAEGLEHTTVPATVAEVFFAATLQALMNSAQHAGADPVARQVSASWAHDELVVVIADDGVGFDTSQESARLGVRKSIVERLESIGGTATVVSSPGHGTTVTLRWTSDSRQRAVSAARA